METPQTFETLLENHDWKYQFADDLGVYERGQAQRERIIALSEESPEFHDMYVNALIAHNK